MYPKESFLQLTTTEEEACRHLTCRWVRLRPRTKPSSICFKSTGPSPVVCRFNTDFGQTFVPLEKHTAKAVWKKHASCSTGKHTQTAVSPTYGN